MAYTQDDFGHLADTVLRLLRRNATKNLARVLDKLRPADIAGLFSRVSDNRWLQLFQLVEPQEKAADVLTEMEIDIQTSFLERLSDIELANLLAIMDSDDAADILEALTEERAAAILALTGTKTELSDAAVLLKYDPDTAGGIMNPDVFALPAAMTAQEAIAELQRRSDELEMVFYLYIINEHGHLVGVCSLRDLVITPPHIQLADLMTTDVLRVTTSTDQEEVARIADRYNLLAVPVVDESNKLVGMITVDDIIDVIRAEATEDMLRMAGITDDSVSERAGVLDAAKARIPWLLASFIGGILAVFVISSFEETLARIAALAAFIPIVLGMGGNVGTQSSTIVTRGIALGRIEISRLWHVLWREVATGVLCGVVYGLILGAVVAIKYHDFSQPLLLSVTIGVSLLCSMTIAALVGGGIPLVFERFRIDPAIAAGPFVTTSVDVLGILIFFLIARFALSSVLGVA
ncbi:MAG: magnesium transporter [Bradymonadales bacterium]|nr:magnesium transporter [Bradymonadales bacterium]